MKAYVITVSQNLLQSNELLVFSPRFCTVRLYCVGDNLAHEVNFVMNHALVQDRSLDLLTTMPPFQSSSGKNMELLITSYILH